MPTRPPIHRAPGTHRAAAPALLQVARPSAAVRGYDHRWRKYRARFLADHPLCVDCMKQGVVTPAKEVDHVIPHKGDGTLFWDPANHQGLCKPCHSRKTASQDGGFKQ